MANRQIGPQAASAAIFQSLWHQHLSGFMNCVKRSKLGTQSIWKNMQKKIRLMNMTQIGGLEWLEDLQLHPYPTGPTANISSLNITELSAVKMAHFKTSQRACMPLGSLPIAFLHHASYASAHGKHPTTQHCPKCSGMLWHALAFLELLGTTGTTHYITYTN